MHGFQVHAVFDLWQKWHTCLAKNTLCYTFPLVLNYKYNIFWIRKQHDVKCIDWLGKGIFHIIGHGICM
jgi:hypothetical protein